jgi:hypothetical protein
MYVINKSDASIRLRNFRMGAMSVIQFNNLKKNDRKFFSLQAASNFMTSKSGRSHFY